MRENFTAALAAVLVHEGGYVNHPADPGGATNRGVTQRVYDAYRLGQGVKAQSVRYITDEEVHAIYKRQYWDVLRCDELPSGVDYAVFDFGVNSGCDRAARYLQMALANPAVKVDGVIGVVTIDAAKNHQNHAILVGKLCEDRWDFLTRLPHFPTFKNGWKSRVDGVRRKATEWTNQRPVVMPTPDPIPVPRKTFWEWLKGLFS